VKPFILGVESVITLAPANVSTVSGDGGSKYDAIWMDKSVIDYSMSCMIIMIDNTIYYSTSKAHMVMEMSKCSIFLGV
jgi:hypothetical protein